LVCLLLSHIAMAKWLYLPMSALYLKSFIPLIICLKIIQNILRKKFYTIMIIFISPSIRIYTASIKNGIHPQSSAKILRSFTKFNENHICRCYTYSLVEKWWNGNLFKRNSLSLVL
jgi:hypothetical protein